MKRAIIFSAYGIFPMLEYELEIAQNLLDEDYQVIFVVCKGDRFYCDANVGLKGPKKRICLECKSRTKTGIEWLSKNNNVIVEGYLEGIDEIDLNNIAVISAKIESFTPDELLNKDTKILVEDIELLSPCISASLTFFRVNKLSNNALHINHLKKQLLSTISFIYSNKKIIDKYCPDDIYVFNGRVPIYNSVLQIALQKNIECSVYEYPLYGYERYIITKNKLAHDLIGYSSSLLNSYQDSIISADEKNKEGARWFDERFLGNLDGFSSDYISKQKDNFLPDKFDENLYVLSIFLTTENELNQVKELDRYKLFNSQLDGVIAISNYLKNNSDVRIYIRMHPNSFADIDFINDLRSLNAPNLVLIEPESPVNTYSLIEASDLVVTFGSTVGIEAAYKEKPVLLLGPAAYFYFSAVLYVASIDKLKTYIENSLRGDYSEFPNRESRKLHACRYAYAHMNFGIKTKYLNRSSYYGGYLRRDNKISFIKANKFYYFYNKIFSLASALKNKFKRY